MRVLLLVMRLALMAKIKFYQREEESAWGRVPSISERFVNQNINPDIVITLLDTHGS